jgi:hypothetical protein
MFVKKEVGLMVFGDKVDDGCVALVATAIKHIAIYLNFAKTAHGTPIVSRCAV